MLNYSFFNAILDPEGIQTEPLMQMIFQSTLEH